MGRLGYSWAAYVKSRKRGKNMGNVYMEASQINYRGGEKKMSVEEALKNTSGEAAAIAQLQQDVADLNDIKANQLTIATTFSAETAYEVGDLVYYNGLSYRCTNTHQGEWDADDFAATTISNELSSLMSGLTNKVKKLELRNLAISLQPNTYDLYDLTENADFLAYINAGYTPISAMSYDSLALIATSHYYATQSKWFVVIYNLAGTPQTANSVDLYLATIG